MISTIVLPVHRAHSCWEGSLGSRFSICFAAQTIRESIGSLATSSVSHQSFSSSQWLNTVREYLANLETFQYPRSLGRRQRLALQMETSLFYPVWIVPMASMLMNSQVRMSQEGKHLKHLKPNYLTLRIIPATGYYSRSQRLTIFYKYLFNLPIAFTQQ